MSRFQLYVSSSWQKTFFSNKKNGASGVALFFQEKIGFLPSRLFTAIRGLLISWWSAFGFQQSAISFQRIALCFRQFILSILYNTYRLPYLSFFFFPLFSRVKLSSRFSHHGSKLLPFPTSHFPLPSSRSPLPTSLLSLAFCLLPLASSAQDTLKKPKIGLVLSGGGAKGFAHVGVLRVIEQAGIKLDYIGGTSMGAVVGGLYASGYNAIQLDSILKEINFDKLLEDYVPRTSKSFYEKRNDELYAFVLPFNKFKIGVPQSLSKGLFNYHLFNRLTKHVRHIRDFNQFPIPFLCIATNIEKGEQVILNKGVLAQAIVASSALPSVFSPVLLEGKLLVDGGVNNNYPIDEVRKLGADIVIGVDVQSGLKTKDELQDATKILFQINNLEMIEKMKINAKNTDIYIKPDINNIDATSFSQTNEIVNRGEEAAFSVYEQLKKYTQKPNSYQKPKMNRVSDSLLIKKIHFGKLIHYTKDYIQGKLKFKAGDKISFKDLENGITNIYGTRNFSYINYSLEPNDDGDNLLLELVENQTTTFLKFGLHYDGLFKSGILINLSNKNNLFKNDVLSVDLILGDNFRYNLDYYIDNGYRLSYGFKSQLNQFNDFITYKMLILKTPPISKTININFLDITNQFYFQSIFAQKFILGLGIEHQNLQINSETIAPTKTSIENSDYGNFYGYMKYDSYDKQYFPTKGWHFNSEIHNYLFSGNYSSKFKPFSIAKADAGVAIKMSKKITCQFQTEAGFTIGDKSIPYFDFALGGYGFVPVNNFKPFYGYDFLSLSGDSYLKSAVVIDYKIFKKNHLNLSANYANIGNGLFESIERFALPKHSGYALGYGLETILGPIEAKYSWSPEIRKGFTWFSIGFSF